MFKKRKIKDILSEQHKINIGRVGFTIKKIRIKIRHTIIKIAHLISNVEINTNLLKKILIKEVKIINDNLRKVLYGKNIISITKTKGPLLQQLI